MAYQTDRGLLPNLALLVDQALRWERGRLVGERGPIPVSEDGTAYVDFVASASIQTRALPAIVFFTSAGAVKPAISDKLRAKLAGGRIAVLVPDGFTGSRFVDGPNGKVLSYVAVVSMMSSALRNVFLHRPAPYGVLVALLMPVGFWIFRRVSGRRAAFIALGGGVTITVVCVSTLFTLGWVLPCAQLVACFSGIGAVRLASDVLRTVAEKLRLRRDLELGTLVQELLHPERRQGRIAGWDYEVVFRPYGFMSGDWFQIFESPPATTEPFAIIAIGDVVGKGPSAALLTSLLAGVWLQWADAWRRHEIDLEGFVLAVDRAVREAFRDRQNTTMSLVLLTETDAKVLTIAAPAWIHFDAAARSAQRIRTPPSNPIGLPQAESRAPRATVVHVAPRVGDLLIAYTDGVIDGSAARRVFMDSLARAEDCVGDAAFAAVAKLASEAGAGSVLPDDFTLLLLRRHAAVSDASTDRRTLRA